MNTLSIDPESHDNMRLLEVTGRRRRAIGDH
jgi:hypothetical protein